MCYSERMTEWQPIETAPKDETVLVWVPSEGRIFAAEWVSYPFPHWQPEYSEVFMLYEEEERATHWMPLPKPPQRG